MLKEMLINVSEGEECRIALIEDGRLEELYMERTSATSHVGNIYKGKVTNVEASIQAAFVDFGLGRNGFLHISDLMPTYFGRNGNDFTEQVGRKLSRRDRPPIQRCLRRGDEIIVQIIKEGIGTKGPTLSTYVSIPGRILVMMPGMSKFGVSRKIEDEDERRRLRGILDSLKPIDDVGFIIRTAGIEKTKTEIQRDLTYLTRLWQNIEKKRQEPSPVELYTEGDLVTRTVRDVFTTDLDRIVVDNEEVAKRIKEFFKIAMPRTKNKVELYDGPVPLFHQAGIEKEIELMYSRHVPLPSGGSLVIDSTEAVVAIDVNSGKFREHNDAEMTAFKTDMEAADEIPRQLKLRDLGGVIICDFIDLRFERNRRELEKRLHDNFRNDRAKTKVLRMSQFGIIELTRQRMRPSLKRSIYFDCPHCKGSGLVKTPESMSLDVMRRLAIAAHDLKVARIELTVCPDVGVYVLNKKRAQLTQLEADTRKRIIVRQDPALGLDEVKFDLFDSRDGNVYLEELGMTPGGESADEPRRRHQGPTQGRRDGRNDRSRQQQPRQAPPPRNDEEDERDELDSAEDAVEDREETRAEQAVSDLAAPPQGAPPRPLPRLPIGRVEGTTIEIGGTDDESSVIEVDEPNEPIGDGPEEYTDEREDRNRSRNQRGNQRDNQRGDQRGDQRRDNRPPHGGSQGGFAREGGRDDRNRGRQDNRRNQQPQNRNDNRNDNRGDNRNDNRYGGQQQRPPIDRPAQGGDRPAQGRPPLNRPPLQRPPHANQPFHGDTNGGVNGGGPGGRNAPAGQNFDHAGESGEGGGRKRRRRRRGRRGRGRNDEGADQQNQPVGESDAGPHPFEQAYNEPHGERDEAGEYNREGGFNEPGRAPFDEPMGESDASAGEVNDRRENFGNRAAPPEPAMLPEGDEGVDEPNGNMAPAADRDADEDTKEQHPRKRRRRGGRRHRRNRDDAPAGDSTSSHADDKTVEAPSPVETGSEAAAEAPAAEAPAEDAAPVKPKRRRPPAKTAAPKTRRSTRKATTVEPPVESSTEPAVAVTPVVRTGSTDRHLVLDDVPVDPEPVRQPRTYRDLDDIPEDLD